MHQSTKSIMQDLAGYRLTILVTLFVNQNPMQNLELCEWCQIDGKTVARHLDYLDEHGYVGRVGVGWMLSKRARQLDFLKEIDTETLRLELSTELSTGQGETLQDTENLRLNLNNPQVVSESDKKISEPDANLNGFSVEQMRNIAGDGDSPSELSTAPTTTTTIKDDSLIEMVKFNPLEEIKKIPAEEMTAIKLELLEVVGLTELAHVEEFGKANYSAAQIFGAYLQLMAEDQHWNKSLLVDLILHRPVHPHHYKQACKMIVNGDY